MTRLVGRLTVAAAAAGLLMLRLSGEEPIRYRFSFPEPEHHWMQVDAEFSALDARPLDLRMSRSSPGRYSLHDFAKNVFDLHAVTPDGRELATTRSDPYGWQVPDHPASVSVHYKVFGDFLDGTYLSIDASHAHINMPAVVLWARGLDDRPVTIALDQPRGDEWRIATQLHEDGSRTFSAPNLQYLVDSPVELGSFTMRQFIVDGRPIRVAAHHAVTNADVDAFVRELEPVVRAEEQVFGEFPPYDNGSYTFIIDSLPYAMADAMEHRNSTVITSRSSFATGRADLLDSAAHEFFHGWNVERIRPRSLEPFDLERVNMSDELWLAEGFTQYYGPLSIGRAGRASLETTLQAFGRSVDAVVNGPGRRFGSVVDMSRLAAFSDRDVPEDRTNLSNTFVSYYDYGAALALSLDLSLRERSHGATSLDDFMRAMWRTYGKTDGAREGYVDRPYTIADAEAVLAQVAGDPGYARDFFARFVRGREVPDFARLLKVAGLALRRRQPGRASWGDVRTATRGGVLRILEPTPANSPAYAAGLDMDDEIREIDGVKRAAFGSVEDVIGRHRPGDTMRVTYADRTGFVKTTTVKLIENPQLEIAPMERVSAEQQAIRLAWLGQ